MDLDPAYFQENERHAPPEIDRQSAEFGPFECESGERLAGVSVAYETWGTLNAARDNAVLICHALSGDSHAVGWWDRLVGPGRPIDTTHYYVIGTNCLGGCRGTTGPSSLGPGGLPFGSGFPKVTVGDMVEVQAQLVARLGIERLRCVAGGSMGGMQALEWTVRRPKMVERAWLTATCAAHSAMQIGFNEAARQAIMRDPKWKGGDYPPDDPPEQGLAVARMIGHLTFLSDEAFRRKFGRQLQTADRATGPPFASPRFQVESYLNYQGEKFTARFDANSFLVLSSAIDRYACAGFAGSSAEYLITSFTSDWLYPPSQSVQLLELAASAGLAATHHEIDLPFGHDAFLLDGERQGELVRNFLARP